MFCNCRNSLTLSFNKEAEMNQIDIKKESMFFKIIAFLSLMDTQVLAQSGRYDRMLAYAMVFRQVVTFAFTFLLFTFGVSLFLGQTAAIISGLVFALTLFFLDQAIIGSDWALKNPFKDGIPVRKLFGLIPRIFYSLIIAIGLATLAEISLQANAIDEQIQKDVVNNNKEYFARMNLYEKQLDTAVNVSENKIKDLQIQVEQARTKQNKISLSQSEYDSDSITNSLNNESILLTKLQDNRQFLVNELSQQNSNLSQVRKDYKFWFDEAIMERTGKDGRAAREGPKYKRAVKTYEELKSQIPLVEADISQIKDKLKTIETEITQETDKLNNFQEIKNALENKESNLSSNSTTITNLENDLTFGQKNLKALIEDKQLKLEENRLVLEGEGLFYERKTGVLTRYLALQKIHNDPEYGEIATLFSYMLKIFFIAIELMPVIIKLFFSPFSFYSLKMYRKMQVALLEEKAKLEHAELEYQYKKQKMQKQFNDNDKYDRPIEKSIMV